MSEEISDRKLVQILARVIVSIEEAMGCCRHKKFKRVQFQWGVGPVTNKNQPPHPMPLEIKITNEQKVTVTLTPKTDAGKPAKLDGAPTWTIVSGDSTLVASADGLSAVLTSADDPGDTEILVKADADLGDGIEEVSDIVKLSVIGASAKNLGLTAGTPELK